MMEDVGSRVCGDGEIVIVAISIATMLTREVTHCALVRASSWKRSRARELLLKSWLWPVVW